MSILEIKNGGARKYDLVALGEVMLRLDPGEGRVRTAREFRVWEGGGEYNVARGLRRCFGLRTAVCTAFVDNDIGRLLEDLILQGGVGTEFVKWLPFDGVGRRARNGLNFTERGFGVRGAAGFADRGHTAASQLKKGDFDWESIFGGAGARWLHTGGIFAALSHTTPGLVLEAILAAKKYGAIVSYDLNYRPSLWKSFGGRQHAQEVNSEIARHVDVMIGNEEDFTACLGLEVEGVDETLSRLDVTAFKEMIHKAVAAYPNFKVVATTLRAVKSATRNDWGAICWADGKFYEAPCRPDLEIFDRVGGGDSFASGLIYGLLSFGDPQKAVDYGAAHGALAMTTPGDTSMASLKEVEALVKGASPRVQR
jgi:2-dehydro-3-deoxygluconokinase